MSRNPTISTESDSGSNARSALWSGRIDIGSQHLQAAGAVLTFLMIALIANSFVRLAGGVEYSIINAVQRLGESFMSTVFDVAGYLTTFTFLLFAWVVVLSVTVAARHWGAVVAVVFVPVAALTAVATDWILSSRPLPDPALLERVIAQSTFLTLPITHVTGATLLFGLLFFLARSIQVRALRFVIETVSVALIALTGFSQLWIGAMWPTDVLMSYTIGGLLLVPLLWFAQRVDKACGNIPLVKAAEVPHDESKPHAHALTSTIIFNSDSTVSKIYRPGFLPRAIYWAAFQAEFPYMRNQAAIRAAVQRRNMIGMLTEFWYGESHVARAVRIDRVNGRSAITSEFIDGGEPSDRDDARAFLRDLVTRFEAAGLPTWQIDPRQPRAIDNVIEAKDGRYFVVDLESGLVSPMASLRTWMRAVRRGQVPLYDDVFFDVTREYVAQHEDEMRQQHGDFWVKRLYATLNAAEAHTREWHDNEPRIWSRMLGRRRSRTSQDVQRQHWAIDWFEGAIDRWYDEGRLTSRQRTQLRQTVHSKQFLDVMPHFGVHLGTGVLLRFPLGSIARASYTSFHLARASWRYLRGQIDRGEWQHAAGIHSPLVIMFAAVPGVGAFAYLASKPILTDHLLLRLGLDSVLLKFPWQIYERSGLRWLITEAPENALTVIKDRKNGKGQQSKSDDASWTWAEEHQFGTRPDQRWSAAAAHGVHVHGIV